MHLPARLQVIQELFTKNMESDYICFSWCKIGKWYASLCFLYFIPVGKTKLKSGKVISNTRFFIGYQVDKGLTLKMVQNLLSNL